jgi:hypothetical protein
MAILGQVGETGEHLADARRLAYRAGGVKATGREARCACELGAIKAAVAIVLATSIG